MEDILSKLPKNANIYWVQEENINGGAFYFVERRIARVMRKFNINSDVQYVGRRAISSTAVGSA